MSVFGNLGLAESTWIHDSCYIGPADGSSLVDTACDSGTAYGQCVLGCACRPLRWKAVHRYTSWAEVSSESQGFWPGGAWC